LHRVASDCLDWPQVYCSGTILGHAAAVKQYLEW
jgi:hypothetical protein